MRNTSKIVTSATFLGGLFLGISSLSPKTEDHPDSFVLTLTYREQRIWNITVDQMSMQGRRDYSLRVQATCKQKDAGRAIVYESDDAHITCKDTFNGSVENRDLQDETGNWSANKTGKVPLKCTIKFNPDNKTYRVHVHDPLPQNQMKYHWKFWGSRFGECEGRFDTPYYLPRIPLDPVPYQEKQPVLTYEYSWRDLSPDVSPGVGTEGGPGCEKGGLRGAFFVQVPTLVHPLVQPYQKSVRWTIKVPEYEVEIVKPIEGDEFVFNDKLNGELEIESRAHAMPKVYEEEIHPWNMDPIQGSKQTIFKINKNTGKPSKVEPVKGPSVLFRNFQLPEDNHEFGKKTITADIAEPVTVKVFFEKEAWNNPVDDDINWFYYWKQGAVPGLDRFIYKWDIDYFGYFDPSDNTLAVGYKAALEDEWEVNLYHGSTNSPLVSKVWRMPITKGVDLCHAVVLHEEFHKAVYDAFHEKITKGIWADNDGDGLPNWFEDVSYDEYGFSPYKADTHYIRNQVHREYFSYGDQELLCLEAELIRQGVHGEDWANPGKQTRIPY